MKQRKPSGRISRRLGASLLAAATLWAVSVTAGSSSAAGAWQSLKEEMPLTLLRWQLGEPAPPDDLSPAAVLALSQSPLLLSARQEVAQLRRQAEEEPGGEAPAPVTQPVQEEPQPAPAPAGRDNGVPAKTLVPTDPSGYTVCGKVYISNSTKATRSDEELRKPFAAELTGDGPPDSDSPQPRQRGLHPGQRGDGRLVRRLPHHGFPVQCGAHGGRHGG